MHMRGSLSFFARVSRNIARRANGMRRMCRSVNTLAPFEAPIARQSTASYC